LDADGWLVLRFWNTEIYDELEAVKEAIYRVCVRRQPTDSPPSP
jgi:very-short-patch-repair endonuclease